MERKDLIGKNVEIIKEHAIAIDSFSKKSVKVLVVANPANTNAMVASKLASSIPPQNFTCLTRLDEERLRSFIVQKARSTRACYVTPADVTGVCIFGNHSATQGPSTEAGSIDFGLRKVPVSELFESNWLDGELVSSVQQRGAAVMNAQGASSAMSAAAAIAKHLRDWLGPNPPHSPFFSMGVISNGNPYGIVEGLWFSFPCKRLSEPGTYEIFGGIELSSSSLDKIALTTSELLQEKADAETFL
jgi:malate dehydrogenase